MKSFEDHNHQKCVSASIDAAKLYCIKNDLRLTSARESVLQILLHGHKALGAYDILEKLREVNKSAKPPTVYRALEFLVNNGLAHRIERLNSYVACTHPGKDHAPAFMICRKCDTVAETRAARRDSPLHDAADMAGFQIEETVLEAQGLCPRCKDD